MINNQVGIATRELKTPTPRSGGGDGNSSGQPARTNRERQPIHEYLKYELKVRAGHMNSFN